MVSLLYKLTAQVLDSRKKVLKSKKIDLKYSER